jgi:hypothetical protein
MICASTAISFLDQFVETFLTGIDEQVAQGSVFAAEAAEGFSHALNEDGEFGFRANQSQLY